MQMNIVRNKIDKNKMDRNKIDKNKNSRYMKCFDEQQADKVRRVHEQISGFGPTSLTELPALAGRLGVKAVFVKDESSRFGLKAFKGLGGTWAMFRMICEVLGLDPEAVSPEELRHSPYHERTKDLVFVTTTDGNHGKGVSWAAAYFGVTAHVFMPEGSAPVRARAIREAGNADVVITDKTYDECVVYTRQLAEENGWLLIQDTSWEGYEKVPLWIMQGYLTMAREAAWQLEKQGFAGPTHVFLQAGVGSMAAAVAAYFKNRYGGNCPVVACAEPEAAACIYESVEAGDGEVHTASGSGQTVMAGLNCGTPCTVAWDILKECMDYAIVCDDELTLRGMRLLGRPLPGDERIISGESGAVTAGILDAVMSEEDCVSVRNALGLNAGSVVLLFSTEGDTDPEHYAELVGS